MEYLMSAGSLLLLNGFTMECSPVSSKCRFHTVVGASLAGSAHYNI